MNEQLDQMYERVEEIRFKLQALKESTTKQPWVSAPTSFEILRELADFAEKDLDDLIQLSEEVQEIIGELDSEEETA